MRNWKYYKLVGQIQCGTVANVEEFAEYIGLQREPNTDAGIPAGYTYFGQFIDHDLTFLRSSNCDISTTCRAPEKLIQGRKPSLDLDSLYGGGLADSIIRFDRETGKFILNSVSGQASDAGGSTANRDLHRGSNFKALVADERNDENLLIAQMHVLFMNFHNKLIDHYFESTTLEYGLENAEVVFELARAEVIRTYQWLVLHDFAKKMIPLKVYQSIIEKKDVAALLHNNRNPNDASMALEFAAAAFRFGHSLIRPSYKINVHTKSPLLLKELFTLTGKKKRQHLPAKRVVDWRFLFKFGAYRHLKNLNLFSNALLIDLTFIEAMRKLKHGNCPVNIVKRNIERGVELGLPSGQQMYAWLDSNHTSFREHFGVQEVDTSKTSDTFWQNLPASLDEYRGNTPLWVYVLAEALQTQQGKKLGPMGAWIVADTLIAAHDSSEINLDSASIPWTPKNSPMYPILKSAKDSHKVDTLTIEDIVFFTYKDWDWYSTPS